MFRMTVIFIGGNLRLELLRFNGVNVVDLKLEKDDYGEENIPTPSLIFSLKESLFEIWHSTKSYNANIMNPFKCMEFGSCEPTGGFNEKEGSPPHMSTIEEDVIFHKQHLPL
jgi:hypothetical protein